MASISTGGFLLLLEVNGEYNLHESHFAAHPAGLDVPHMHPSSGKDSRNSGPIDPCDTSQGPEIFDLPIQSSSYRNAVPENKHGVFILPQIVRLG